MPHTQISMFCAVISWLFGLAQTARASQRNVQLLGIGPSCMAATIHLENDSLKAKMSDLVPRHVLPDPAEKKSWSAVIFGGSPLLCVFEGTLQQNAPSRPFWVQRGSHIRGMGIRATSGGRMQRDRSALRMCGASSKSNGSAERWPGVKTCAL